MDWRIRSRLPDKTFGRDVKVVLLDEPLMEQLPYRSPVPRDMLSKLIRIVSDSGAGLIGLDIFLKNLTWQKHDRKLHLSMKESGRVVIISVLRESGGAYRTDMPHDRFLEAALATGLSDLPIDPLDQRVRHLQLYYEV